MLSSHAAIAAMPLATSARCGAAASVPPEMALVARASKLVAPRGSCGIARAQHRAMERVPDHTANEWFAPVRVAAIVGNASSLGNACCAARAYQPVAPPAAR